MATPFIKEFNVKFEKRDLTFRNKTHYIINDSTSNEIFFILEEFCGVLTNGWKEVSKQFQSYAKRFDSREMGKLYTKCVEKIGKSICIRSGLGIWVVGKFLQNELGKKSDYSSPSDGLMVAIMQQSNWSDTEKYKSLWQEFVSESEKEEKQEKQTKAQLKNKQLAIVSPAQDRSLIMRYEIQEEKNLSQQQIEDRLKSRVLYQDAAIKLFTSVLYVHIFTHERQRRYPTVIHLVGPSGVGKTTTINALADILHIRNTPALVQKQGTSFIEETAIAQLRGAPPSYQGYDASQPTLVEELEKAINYAAENRTVPVLFFDEIHEAHKNTFITLRALIDNSLEDSRGMKCCTQNLLLICGSNFAADDILQHQEEQNKKNQPPNAQYLMTVLGKAMQNEKGLDSATIARFGTPIPYQSFDEEQMRAILTPTIRNAFTEYLAESKQIHVQQIDPSVLEALMEGYDRRFGVRLQERDFNQCVNRLSQQLEQLSIDRRAVSFILSVETSTDCSASLRPTKFLRLHSMENKSVDCKVEFNITSYSSRENNSLDTNLRPTTSLSTALQDDHDESDDYLKIPKSLSLSETSEFGIPVLVTSTNPISFEETYICNTKEWVQLLNEKEAVSSSNPNVHKLFSNFLTQASKKAGKNCICNIKLSNNQPKICLDLRNILLEASLLKETVANTRLYKATVFIDHWKAFRGKEKLKASFSDSVSNAKKRKNNEIVSESNNNYNNNDNNNNNNGPGKRVALNKLIDTSNSSLDNNTSLVTHEDIAIAAIEEFAAYKTVYCRYVSQTLQEGQSTISGIQLKEDYTTSSKLNTIFANVLLENDRLQHISDLMDDFQQQEEEKKLEMYTLDAIHRHSAFKVAAEEEFCQNFMYLTYGESQVCDDSIESAVIQNLRIASYYLLHLLAQAKVDFPDDQPLVALGNLIDRIAQNMNKVLTYSSFFTTMTILLRLPKDD